MDDDLREIEDYREREHYSLDPRDQPFADDDAWAHEMREPEAEQDKPSWLDPFDVAALNAARTVLTKLGEHEGMPDTDATGWERDFHWRAVGHLQGMAEEAEQSLFNLLNYAKHHLGIEVTDGQMFNRDDEE